MAATRLYIATRDPRDGGGVESMAKLVYRVADSNGYDPCLVFNSLERDRQVRLTAPWQYGADGRTEVHHFEYEGVECKAVPFVIPEVEFLHYRANLRYWNEAIEDGDRFFSVGGFNHCSLPFVFGDRPYGSWTATLLWDDRVDRLESAPLLERLRDLASKPILEFLERRAFECSEPTFVLSEYTADRAVEIHGLSRGDLEVVPYPVDADTFTPEGERVASEGPTVLFVGRFNDPRKNVPMLFEAFRDLRDDFPEARLLLVGAEPDERLRRAVKSNGIESAVEFVGRVPNESLPPYYRAADAFVIPSNQEGLAIVGLEAMACGTPVVSTRCGGPEQYVHEGETGYLVPRDDAVALSERLRTTLQDDDHRADMGAAARALVEETYAEDVVERRFQRAFRSLEPAGG